MPAAGRTLRRKPTRIAGANWKDGDDLRIGQIIDDLLGFVLFAERADGQTITHWPQVMQSDSACGKRRCGSPTWVWAPVPVMTKGVDRLPRAAHRHATEAADALGHVAEAIAGDDVSNVAADEPLVLSYRDSRSPTETGHVLQFGNRRWRVQSGATWLWSASSSSTGAAGCRATLRVRVATVRPSSSGVVCTP